MEDKYLPGLDRRKEQVFAQIEESRNIIYRNMLEDLQFAADNEKPRREEVVINNRRLSEKINLLLKEWDKLSEESLTDYESRRRSALSGPVI